MAVDEHIARFQGRSHETTTIPSKPEPIGYKIWVIAQDGYFLQWVQHTKGAGKGYVGVPTPPELGGSKNGIGGNKTAAIAAYLLGLLLFYTDPGRYIVYLDNLFTSLPLLKYLRSRGQGATRTAYTNSGILKEYVDLKAMDKKRDQIPWGTLYHAPIEDNLVNQIAQKDNALVLYQSIVDIATKTVL